MQIAINCRSILLKKRTGIGRYTYHLVDQLGHIDQINTYLLHAPKRLFDFKRSLPNFSRYKNFKNRLDYWHQGPGASDIYHLPCPDAIGPHSGKLIVTVHDMVYKTHPQSHTAQTIELTDKYMQAIAARADKIICISENTRQDVKKFLNVPDEKMSVVYNGVDHAIFYRLSIQERGAAAHRLREVGIDKPYILYVGTIEPRKNLIGLLESFALLKARKSFAGQLVVVGMKGWMTESIQETIKKLGITQDIIFTGFISDDQLRELYNLAEVFAFPSFYEGFGFPIVEAFCCGAAVLTSNNSSCGEIAGPAAVTIDPADIHAMTEGLSRILGDQGLKASLSQAGLKRGQDFSFSNTAKKTLDVYRQTV